MKLNGMLEIARYTGLSESTIICLKKDKDFPMDNVDGVWESSTEEINYFRGDRSLSKSQIKQIKMQDKIDVELSDFDSEEDDEPPKSVQKPSQKPKKTKKKK